MDVVDITQYWRFPAFAVAQLGRTGLVLIFFLTVIPLHRIDCHLAPSHEKEQIAQEYFELANNFVQEKNVDKATIYYQKALHINPHHFQALYGYGNILRDQEKLDEAVQLYRTAYTINPGHLAIVLELANALNMLDQIDEALELYLNALKISPTCTTALHNLAYTLKKKGHVTQAIQVFEALLQQAPNYALAHFNISNAYLYLGDFERGWQEYEWRWAAYNESPKKFESPLWNGEPLYNKTILIYSEQGYGDTFQFIRYLKVLKQQGARVIFATLAQTALKPIMQLCPYIDQIILPNENSGSFDFHAPLMSLPLLCKTTVETVPCDIPYLFAAPQLISEWKKFFDNDPNRKNGGKIIGTCWNGNSRYPTLSLRKAVAAKSIPLAQLAQLSKIPQVSIYSLQKVDGVDQLSTLPPDVIIKTLPSDFDSKYGRFMDTAAIMKNCDLIITVDTSIAHLAGGLGVPVWLILPEPCDFRWLYNRTDSPWYPTMRIFKQTTAGNWDSVLYDITQALYAFLEIPQKITLTPAHANPLDALVQQTIQAFSGSVKQITDPQPTIQSPPVTCPEKPTSAQPHNLSLQEETNYLEAYIKQQVKECLKTK